MTACSVRACVRAPCRVRLLEVEGHDHDLRPQLGRDLIEQLHHHTGCNATQAKPAPPGGDPCRAAVAGEKKKTRIRGRTDFRRAERISRAPRSARSRASAKPIPELAPVILSKIAPLATARWRYWPSGLY